VESGCCGHLSHSAKELERIEDALIFHLLDLGSKRDVIPAIK